MIEDAGRFTIGKETKSLEKIRIFIMREKELNNKGNIIILLYLDHLGTILTQFK